MLQLSAIDIRSSFINASLRERKALTLPRDFDTLPWDTLDYLGWRDPKIPGIGYVIVDLPEGPVGMLLRQADGKTRTRPQCSWCEDVHLPNEVVFFSIKRAGQAGRNGDTVGTLACAGFECSANVRKLPPVAYVGFDVQAARQRRIEALGVRVSNLARSVRDGT
ncbi:MULTISPECIES: FBP domain-containing protein [Cryobacterium]|uniref:FBP domain-containing protein n=1 Tax=Cryobacterium breve TaxID=1259258 RepID=A0ABY2J0A1_9MICO|nr:MULTISPECIES: FBP domain-containing protein [Cryobacterium]TFC97066.1 FBP domain-containing protein [Cryobacterium sp. TmT3-12]TFC97138.1 FBP domain-containing protein [Cryobacterium breve]